MPPDSSSTRVSRRARQVRDLERPLDRRRALVPAEPVEPREHAQVLLDRERGVEVVELGDDPALRPSLLRLAGQPVAEHLELALVGDRLGRQHLHGRRLAGAVRSQEPDAGARRHVQLEAVDRGDRAEALRHAPQSDRNVGVACHDPHGIAGGSAHGERVRPGACALDGLDLDPAPLPVFGRLEPGPGDRAVVAALEHPPAPVHRERPRVDPAAVPGPRADRDRRGPARTAPRRRPHRPRSRRSRRPRWRRSRPRGARRSPPRATAPGHAPSSTPAGCPGRGSASRRSRSRGSARPGAGCRPSGRPRARSPGGAPSPRSSPRCPTGRGRPGSPRP